MACLGTLVAALACGCASNGTSTSGNGPASQVVLLDSGVQHSISSPAVQMGRTADGRLKVVAQLRNRENRRIEVQANCVFKDAQGFTVDETPYRTVILDENATQDVAFEAFNPNAVLYTIRVRQAR